MAKLVSFAVMGTPNSRSYLILIFSFCVFTAQAKVRLPYLIDNGMVLQRETNLKIWGWARNREKIKLVFKGKTLKTTTDTAGKWSFLLPAMPTGGPYQMEVIGDNHITLKNIMIGDVWFCSGQSNMTIKMERVKEKYPEEIAAANYPDIRYFFVPTSADISKDHEDLPPGKWVSATKENILDIGAISYFFAKQLYSKYRIPIGIINSSVGGTPIQAWVDEQAIKKIGNYNERLLQIKDNAFIKALSLKNTRVIPNGFEKATDKGLSESVKWYDTAYKPEGWHKFWLPGYWADQGVNDLNGIVWFRKEVEIPAEMAGKPAKLFLGRIIDADETYVNGKLVGNITYQYPPRRYEIPAGLLKAGTNTITVRVTNTENKGGFVPDKRYELTNGTTTIDLRGDWLYQVGLVYSARTSINSGSPIFSAQNEPAGLYHAMVAPVISYAVKGFIWYQGETNVGTKNYSLLLSTLIHSWRQKWQLGDLPFLTVQLPNFGEVKYSPAESDWALIREAQLEAAKLPNTAVTINIDLGEWNDIHPLNKKDVAERLALAAQKLSYGEKDLVASGPTLKSAKIEAGQIELTFANTGGGMVVKGGGPLSQFAVAGEDKKFIWATAEIKGDRVILTCPQVSNPIYVRYAWADNPEGANLYNAEGLPSSPFRTDKP